MDNAAYYNWPKKRNTGMKVTWRYESGSTVAPRYNFTDDNKQFIRLVNLIHQGFTETDLESLTSNTLVERCGKNRDKDNKQQIEISYDVLDNLGISSQPIYQISDITEDSLILATTYYFRIKFCPDYDKKIQEFYTELLEKYSLESYLKTLMRILYVANDKGRFRIKCLCVSIYLLSILKIENSNNNQ